MYYLQSRYYDPDLCRFISADGFEYLTTEGKLNLNAYVYCWNCPVIFDDIEGTTPQLSINLSDIISFIKNINNKIKDGISSEINKIKDKYTKLFNNWKKSLITHYNSFIDKLEYFINYPDAVINSALSKLFNTEINIRFGLVEFIRDKLGVSISLSSLKYENRNNKNDIAPYYVISEDEKTDNWLEAVLKGLVIFIEVDTYTRIFEGIIQIVNKSFDLNRWFNKLSIDSQDLFIDMNVLLSSITNTVWVEGKDYIKEFITAFSFDKIVELLIKDNGVSLGLGSLISFTSAFNDRDEGKYTTGQAWISVIVNVAITAISVFVPMNAVTALGVSATSFFTNLILDGVFNFQNGHLWGI